MGILTLPTVTNLQLVLATVSPPYVTAHLYRQKRAGDRIELANAIAKVGEVRVETSEFPAMHQVRIGAADFLLSPAQAHRARAWLHGQGITTATGEACKPAPAVEFHEGQAVHYHPIIGEAHDGKVYVITHVGRAHSGHRVAWLDGKSGFVVLEALSAADAQAVAA